MPIFIEFKTISIFRYCLRPLARSSRHSEPKRTMTQFDEHSFLLQIISLRLYLGFQLALNHFLLLLLQFPLFV